jgi:hypothetical protein
LNPSIRLIFSTSLITEASERLLMNLPWWAAMAQKLHPPKQPRWMLTENFIISHAGMAPFFSYADEEHN